jgi:small-conductance mechanosensitive channel
MQIVIGIICLIIAIPLIAQLIAVLCFLGSLLFDCLLMPIFKLLGWLFVVAIVPTYQHLSFFMTPGLIVVGVVLAVAFVINLIKGMFKSASGKRKKKQRQ